MTAQAVELIEATESGPAPTIEFVAPMPGFPNEREFLLVPVDEDGLLYALSAVATPGLRFLVAPPAPFFPDYAPEVDEESLSVLASTDPDDLLVLLVITAGVAATDATANLMAPIVVQRHTRKAVQLVLGGSGLPARAPLLAS
jgi:flagellar assembly factor FliW